MNQADVFADGQQGKQLEMASQRILHGVCYISSQSSNNSNSKQNIDSDAQIMIVMLKQ